jgi:hypothetical protein
MADYLMIENPGVSGVDMLTVIGAISSRGREDSIGQIGSGNKFAIAKLLRDSCYTRLYNGKDGYEFTVDDKESHDVHGRTHLVREVMMKQIAGSGRRARNLGFDMTFGEIDWKAIGMALRELISNAADGAFALDGNYSRVKVSFVDENQVRARDGYTRWFIQANSDVRDYIKNLAKHFLCFDPNYDRDQMILDKREGGEGVRIYRKGVLVAEYTTPSLFDYQLNDVKLDESRNCDEWTARWECARALRRAGGERLARVLQAFHAAESVFETEKVSVRDLKDNYLSTEEKVKRTEDWQLAARKAFGAEAVICDNLMVAMAVVAKGHKAITLRQEVADILRDHGVKGADQVLNRDELEGRQRKPLSDQHLAKIHKMWELFDATGLTLGKPLPNMIMFDEFTNANSEVLGYYDNKTKTIGLNSVVLENDFQLMETMIEEVAHYVTGAGDFTRDMQNWPIRLAARMLHAKLG